MLDMIAVHCMSKTNRLLISYFLIYFLLSDSVRWKDCFALGGG